MIRKIHVGTLMMPGPTAQLSDRLAIGNYTFVAQSIVKGLMPLSIQPGPRDLWLACFNKVIHAQEVEKYAASEGLRIGVLDDLLLLGPHAMYGGFIHPLHAIGSYIAAGAGRYETPCTRPVPDKAKDLVLKLYDMPFPKEAHFVLVNA